MFDEKTLEQCKKLEGEWQKEIAERYQGKDFSSTTNSGIPLKPMYMPSDIQGLDFEKEVGAPGIYPFMRSNYPIHYQFQPWVNQPVHGFGLPEHTRKRMDLLADAGMAGYFGGRSYNIVWDVPSQFGVDPDEPEAEGYVGKDGVSCNNGDDFARMLHDIDLTKTNIVVINGDTVPMFAHYIAYADSQGYPRDKLRGNTMNWTFSVFYAPNHVWETEDGLKLATEVVNFCCKEVPQWNHTNIQGHGISESGADAIHQTAFCLSIGIALADSCVAAGLDPNAFLTGIGFQIAQCNDFFEYICMFRAWRKLWATICRERYGAKRLAALHLRTHTHTSCYELSKEQPLVNLIRSSYHALGSALSGTTAMEISAYDEPIGIPTEESAVLALRIQQVLAHETGITRVSDPLAGSYYVEWLTHKMEEEARKALKQIEDAGGYVKAEKSGLLQAHLRQNAAKWRQEVDSGKRIIVGWNKYTVAEKQIVKPFRADPKVGEISKERMIKYKAERDQAKTDAALNALVAASERLKKGEYGHVMPACIEAAKAKATAGEISKTLRKVFRWGPEYKMSARL